MSNKGQKINLTRVEQLRNLAMTIARHQMLIQQLASRWGAMISEKLDAVEKQLIDEITKALQNTTRQSTPRQMIKELLRLEKQIKAIRKTALDAAKAEIREESVKLAENEGKWAKRITKELTPPPAEEEPKSKQPLSDLPEKTINALPDQTIVEGKTFEQWFENLEDGDIARIRDTVQRGVSEGWTINDVIKKIRGTRANNYEDGILHTSRIAASRMARTLCSGVANQAKHEFYQQNGDIVVGEEWLSTLDGRTCLQCGSLDRQRWGREDRHPIPPLHHNCRCVLLPITILSDLAENLEERPMANADFEEEARLTYCAKYPTKNWDALSASTRKKYYYQAINEYERIHGEGSAFSQVPGSVKYREFLEQASPDMQKSILGKYRYEQYKAGKLKINDFLPPWPDRTLTVAELKKRDKASFNQP